MDANNFYIKRIEFVKTIPKKYDNLNNFWVVCFETGDYINKVSNYFTKIETFNDLKTLNYELRNLLDEHMTFYTKITKYININPNNIKMIDDLILNYLLVKNCYFYYKYVLKCHICFYLIVFFLIH